MQWRLSRLSIIAAILCLFMVTPSFAAESSRSLDDSSFNAIFNQEEIEEALNGESDRAATLSDVMNVIYSCDEVTYDPPYIPDINALATAEDFLDMLSVAFDGVYYYKDGDSYVYPAGSSMWLSAGEWTSLTGDPSQPVTLGTVKVLVQRTIDCNAYLENRKHALTYERYRNVVENFFPEFLSLVESNQNAVTYWLDPDPNAGVLIYNKSNFARIIHELLHEESAKQAGAFEGRKASDNAWAIAWARKPASINYYDVSSHGWVSLDTSKKLPEGGIINTTAPASVMDTQAYKTYFSSKDTTANSWGLYGMLQEFCSAVAEMRVHTICASIDFHYEDLPDSRLQEYYFWKGAILNYLAVLSEENPEMYASLLANEDLATLLVNLFDYADEQITLAGTTEPLSEDTLAVLQWSTNKASSVQESALRSNALFPIEIKIT